MSLTAAQREICDLARSFARERVAPRPRFDNPSEWNEQTRTYRQFSGASAPRVAV